MRGFFIPEFGNLKIREFGNVELIRRWWRNLPGKTGFIYQDSFPNSQILKFPNFPLSLQ
jgi:hypothetical protein